MRGVEKPGSVTSSSAFTGAFASDRALRAEFLLRLAGSRASSSRPRGADAGAGEDSAAYRAAVWDVFVGAGAAAEAEADRAVPDRAAASAQSAVAVAAAAVPAVVAPAFASSSSATGAGAGAPHIGSDV